MGRLATERRLNKGSSTKPYSVGYTYYEDGSLNTLTYPSGNVVTYQVAGAGLATKVSDSSNTYVNSATYSPHGALVGMTSGSGIITSNIYNNRLQPTLLSAGLNGQNPFFSLCYDFHSGAAINNGPCAFNAHTSGNNGNVFQVIDNYDSTRSATFSYDLLNRITQGNTINTTSANCWGEVYSLDGWGNLTNIGPVSSMGSCWHETFQAPTATNLNQFSGSCYDAGGNLLLANSVCPTGSFTPTYAYDAENRLSNTAGYNYYYDADSVRIEKSSGTSGTMYWLGAGGEYLTETDLTGAINEEYVYFNGERIARVDRPTGTVHYYFSDKLNSASTITDPSGTVQERYYYYPYGGLVASLGSDTNHYKFTGKERDSESGLDMFGARYYGSSLGRFMTPDWAAKPISVPYANFGNPQSLNLYSYVENNPLTLVDTDGHDIIYADNLKNAQVVKDTVQAILADPHTSGNLSGYVGKDNPNLVIQSGDLSGGDTRTVNPDGSVTTTTILGNTQPDIQTTSGSSTFGDVTTTSAPETTLTGATITIDNRVGKGDVEGVMVHESVHAGEAKSNPGQFSKDAAAEKSMPHDQRPQEQRPNAAQQSYTKEIKQAVKQIEKDRKKDPNQ